MSNHCYVCTSTFISQDGKVYEKGDEIGSYEYMMLKYHEKEKYFKAKETEKTTVKKK